MNNMQAIRRWFRDWFGWLLPVADETAPAPVVERKPLRYGPNDYNIDAQGVMRRGSLTPGVGHPVDVPPPRLPTDARWTTLPLAESENPLGQFIADSYVELNTPLPTDTLAISNLYADIAEVLIKRGADERLVEFIALQADAAPIIARAVVRARREAWRD